MSNKQHFKVTRSVTMQFVQVMDVIATSKEEVVGLTADFLETDWSPDEQARLGVRIISEEGAPAEDVAINLVIESIAGPLEQDPVTASRLASDTLMRTLDTVKH